MKKIIVNFLFLTFSTISFAQEINFKERAEENIHFLIRNEVLHNQIKIDDEGVKMYASKTEKNKDKYEFFIPWNMAEEFIYLFEMGNHQSELDKIYNQNKIFRLKTTRNILKNKEQGLRGKTIVLDPGHFAHNFKTAILERKFMKMKGKELGQKKDIQFYEADLAYRTAKILKKRLEKKGANVIITHKKGKSASGKKFKKRFYTKELKEDLFLGKISQKKYNWYRKEASKKDIFKYMNRKDLMHRSTLINSYNPDLTIMIHYNASGKNIRKDGYYSPVESNYCLAFTGGGFMTGELRTTEAKMNFLRLLLSEDLEKSIAVSSNIMKQHEKIAAIPIVKNKNKNPYHFRNSVYANEPGVYCRNLGLTRRVWSPICFGESLLQDNKIEALLLSKRNYKEKGTRIPRRLKQIIDAYEKGIEDYFVNLEN